MSLHPLDSTLIVGAGPAAHQVAVLLSSIGLSTIGLTNRCSSKWNQFLKLYRQEQVVKVSSPKKELHSMIGQVTFDPVYERSEHIEDIWQQLILCVPSDAYLSVLNHLPLHQLSKLKTIILLSPAFGSHALIEQYLESQRVGCEVICLSNYFAATKYLYINDQPVLNHVVTKARKKRVYLASNYSQSPILKALQALLLKADIDSQQLPNPFSVEARNITSYVHPALFINKFSLEQIASKTTTPKYMYKLYPEGPITPRVIQCMVNVWKEISTIVRAVKANPINLLQFLNDDNYPIHDVVISREKIDNFSRLSSIEQEFLLFTRYAAILIDPFSKPDAQGKYYDFSAVPYPKANVVDGQLMLPRVPLEDIQSLYIFNVLGKKLSTSTNTIDGLIACFENWYRPYDRNNKLILKLAHYSKIYENLPLLAMGEKDED